YIRLRVNTVACHRVPLVNPQSRATAILTTRTPEKGFVVINRICVVLVLAAGLVGQGYSHSGRLCIGLNLDANLDALAIGKSVTGSPHNNQQETPARNFEVQKLAEGVYAVIRKDLPGLMVDANNVFIINDADVVVVDANGAPSITREVLAALKKLTNKPVKYVINT